MDAEFWQCFGRLFCSLLVPVNVVANVVSVWAWCSQGSLWSVPMVSLLGLSHMVAVASVLSSNTPRTAKHRILLSVLLSPIMPVMHCLQTGRESEVWDLFTAGADTRRRGVREALARARLEVEWCEPDLSTVGVDNLMLVVHAGVSLPLAAVQLLAMSTSADEPTVAQIVAIGTSFLTLCVTGILFCRAFTLRVVVFQAACVVFDVASTFYTGATLFAVQMEHDTTWLGVGVSWQGSVLLWKGLVLYGVAFAILSFVVGMWDGVVSMWDSRRSRVRGIELIFVWLYTVLFSVFILGPVVVVTEAIRLTWLIPVMRLVEPDEKPPVALLVSFCRDANVDLRSRFVATRLGHTLGTAANAAIDVAARQSTPFNLENAILKAVGSSVNERLNDALFEGFDSAEYLAARTCFHFMLFTQLLSIAYVIVTGARQHSTHTLVQAMLFYASCASLLTALYLSREAWIYARRCAAFARVPRSYNAVTLVQNWFGFITPLIEEALVKHGVGVSTLPTEVTQLVAKYFSNGDTVESGVCSIRHLESLVDSAQSEIPKPPRPR